MHAVQLLENEEYHFEVHLESTPNKVTTDKPEILQPDTRSGSSGRLRPGLNVGTLSLGIQVDGAPIGHVVLEVRSRKLNYLTEFGWMLRDIADEAAEVVMQRFAPAEQRFEIDDSADAETLYQRFAFLRSVLQDDSLDAAIHQVLSRPYVAWVDEEEVRSANRGVRPSSQLARQLAAPGRRIACPAELGLPVLTLPEQISAMRTGTSVDNPPNQFLRFALTRWRDVLLLTRTALERLPASATVSRGLQETRVVLDHLDALLAEELFREVSDLSAFPAGNQVLQKREGYRDVFRAYVQFELAAKLGWKGGDDVYRAGQRDVAALYEYWCFFQLAKVIARLCDTPFDFSKLIEVDENGLGVSLRRGHASLVEGGVSRLGRRLGLELSFNRTFLKGTGSWSTDLRPDCSLQISPEELSKGDFDPIWLHFDAKYRVEALADVFEFDVGSNQTGTTKRDDLLKMHAYRDAIRRSAGAYVLYPGDVVKSLPQYNELLPGLGAFPLKPTASGEPDGADSVERFLNDVLDHVATQITQHERGRYWRRRVYERGTPPAARPPAAHFLRRPPADTRVLLGYVRGRKHLDWIHRTRLYNLRATGQRGRVGLRSRELDADLVVLYGDVVGVELWRVAGMPELHTKVEMVQLGYPAPKREAYYCIPIREVPVGDWASALTLSAVREVLNVIAVDAPVGAPVTTSWLRFAEVAWRRR